MTRNTSASQRCVFVLANDLVWRIQAFKTEKGIASDTEAARRLLAIGLEVTESLEDLLERLRLSCVATKNIRDVASGIVSHQRVRSISFLDDAVEFKYSCGRTGRLTVSATSSIHGVAS